MNAIKDIAIEAYFLPVSGLNELQNAAQTELVLVFEGKTHRLQISPADSVLRAALAAGIDVPHGCTVGMCGSCRARVISGEVMMESSTLSPPGNDQGFVLTCLAYCASRTSDASSSLCSLPRVVISWDPD